MKKIQENIQDNLLKNVSNSIFSVDDKLQILANKMMESISKKIEEGSL